MARALLIGPEEVKAIRAAVERARDKPVSYSAAEAKNFRPLNGKRIIELKDRPEFFRPKSEFVQIPIGFLAAVSFEHQPAGLYRHLSVSVDSPGRLPNEHAMEMILKEFGFGPFPIADGTGWLEEFEKGHSAINVIQLESTVRPWSSSP